MSYQWSRADEGIGQGFLRIAREQINKAVGDAEEDGKSPERRIHEARRRCKKLRALFRLVRPDFPEYERENAFVRDAARGLSQARDTHVARQTYADLMQRSDRVAPPVAEEPGDEAKELQALQNFAAQMHALHHRSGDWKLDRIDLETLANGLKRTYRRARWTRRFAERHRTDDAFHEWRKYAKYHWNQLGLLEDCAQDIMPSAHKSAGELAEHLGLHHDLAVLAAIVEHSPSDLEDEVDVPFTTEAITKRQKELEDRIAALGQQVFAETPKALKARFAAYFSGWTIREAAE